MSQHGADYITLENAMEAAGIPEEQRQKIRGQMKTTKHWARRHQDQLIFAGGVLGALYLARRFRKRITAKDIQTLQTASDNFVLEVTPKQMVALRDAGVSLYFETDVTDLILSAAKGGQA